MDRHARAVHEAKRCTFNLSLGNDSITLDHVLDALHDKFKDSPDKYVDQIGFELRRKRSHVVQISFNDEDYKTNLLYEGITICGHFYPPALTRRRFQQPYDMANP